MCYVGLSRYRKISVGGFVLRVFRRFVWWQVTPFFDTSNKNSTWAWYRLNLKFFSTTVPLLLYRHLPAGTDLPFRAFGFHFIRNLCVLFSPRWAHTHARHSFSCIRFQSRTAEIDWGLFYAVITDFYLPLDTVNGKRKKYTRNHIHVYIPGITRGFRFDGMGEKKNPIASKSRGI